MRTYTALIGLGVLFSLVWLYVGAPPGKATRWLDAGLAATLGAIIGARLVYAWFNSGYYLAHLFEVLAVWQGGLAWAGAVLGGLLGLGLYGLRRAEPVWPMLDRLALPVCGLSLLGWAACWASGCAYGQEVSPGQLPNWPILLTPDLYGVTALRWPTQLAGMLWSVAALGLLLVALRRPVRWGPGAFGAGAVALVALGAGVIGFACGDPLPLMWGGRIDLWAGGGVAVLAIGMWGWRMRSARAVNSE